MTPDETLRMNEFENLIDAVVEATEDHVASTWTTHYDWVPASDITKAKQLLLQHIRSYVVTDI